MVARPKAATCKPARKSGGRKPTTRKTRKATARKTTASRRKATARKTMSRRRASQQRWSQRVTQESDALDLKRGVFKLTNPKQIAASLKRSAEQSTRRKANPYRSALSMLTFYINRAGSGLPKTQRARLERAKLELKHQFGRE
jgi:type IV secretory pathway VirB10-like protein